MSRGALHFEMTMDNSQYLRKIRESRQAIIDSGKTAEVQGAKIEGSFKRMAMGAGLFFGVQQATDFIRTMVQVRGEFQQLEVSFATLLQSKEKANRLMAELVDLAAKTPFTMQDVASGAKQLIAYGFAAEDVGDTLVRLGDISSGLGLPLNRLTYLYGTTMTQGRLYARDLMQFTTSGIPMLQGLADMYGVTTQEVNKMVSAGKIGFPEVKKVIENLTNEGGKFHNLMFEISKTITGKISNLGDSISIMFNEMGKSQEGFISDSLDGARYMVENYEKIGRVLAVLIATYGAYKTAIITSLAWEKAKEISLVAQQYNLSKLLILKKRLKVAMLGSVNPYALAFAGAVALGVGIWQAVRASGALERELDKIKGIEFSNAEKEIDRLKDLKEAYKDAAEGSQNRRDIIDVMNNQFGGYFSNLLTEKDTIDDITIAYNEATTAIRNKAHAQALEKGHAAITEKYQSEQIEAKNSASNVARLLFGEKGKKNADDIEAEFNGYIKHLNANIKDKEYSKGESKKLVEDTMKEWFKNDKIWMDIGKDLSEATTWRGNYGAMHLHDYINSIAGENISRGKYNNDVDALNRGTEFKTNDELRIFNAIDQKYNKLETDIIGKGGQNTEKVNKDLAALRVDRLQELIEGYEGLKYSEEVATEQAKKHLKIVDKQKESFTELQTVISKLSDEQKNSLESNDLMPKKDTDYYEYVSKVRKRASEIPQLIDDAGVVGDKDALEKELALLQTVATTLEIDLFPKDGGNKRMESYLDAEIEYLKSVQDQIAKMNLGIHNTEIELEIGGMEDGLDKEIKIIELKYAKLLIANKEVSEKWIEELTELKKKEWLAEDATRKESDFRQELSIAHLSPEQQDALSRGEAQIKKDKEAETAKATKDDIKAKEDEFKELKQKYETYYQALLRIEKEYDIERKKLYNKDGTFKDGVNEDNLNEINTKESEDVIAATDGHLETVNGKFEEWASSIVSLSLKKLKALLKEAESEIDSMEDGDKKDKAKASATVIKGRIAEMENPNSANNDWRKMYETLQDVNSEFEDIGKTVGGTVGEIIDTAGQITTSAMSMINSIQSLGNGVITSINAAGIATTRTLTGLEKASIILAIAGAALQIITAIAGVFDRTDYMAEFRKEMELLNDELGRLKLNARIDSFEGTIFGDDPWGNMINNVEVAKEALIEYDKSVSEVVDRNSGLASVMSMFGIEVPKFDSPEDSVSNMQIQTRHSTWFRSAKYASLGDSVPELFDDETGKLDMDALEGFLGSDAFNKLSEENQKYLIDMSENWGTYQDAVEAVNSYITDIFGDTASTIADRMIDAFIATGDAAIELGDIVSDVAKKMAKDIVQSMLIDEIFNEEAMEKMKVFMGNDDSAGAIDYFNELMGQVNTLAPDVQEFLEGISGHLGEGDEDNREASAKGMGATASQESMNEYTGMVRSGLGMLFELNENQKEQLKLNIESLSHLRHLGSMNNHLSVISENTAHCKRLEAMEVDMRLTRIGIEKMVGKGVRINK